MKTEVVQLRYADAKEVEIQLRAKIDAKSVGSIFADTRSNQIVVSAYPERMNEIIPLIESLDTKTQAVLIEVRILKLTINPKFDYGINWNKIFQDSNHDLIKALDIQGAFPIDSAISSPTNLNSIGRLAIGEIPHQDMELEIRALKQVQKTNVLANPRLMILDRQEAKINIGDRIPYVVTTTTGTGNNVSISQEIVFIDVGVSLVVTPVINEDGFITMTVRPEISSKTGDIRAYVNTDSAGNPIYNEIPIVNTTFLESSIIVKDGTTIIIGGLRREDLTEDTKGYPYLMDIPFIGNLFKSRADSITKTEIVIFITPKIVSGAENITDEPLPIKQNIHVPKKGNDVHLAHNPILVTT